MEKLTIEQLTPFLPYGLNMIFEKSGRIINVSGIKRNENNGLSVIASDGDEYDLGIWKFKPIIHDLSSLTIPIIVEGYNGGEPFVPIVELAKIADNSVSWDLKTIQSYENEYSKGTCFYLIGLTSCLSEKDTEMEFQYDSGWFRFALRNNTRSRPLSFSNQLQLFQSLYKWHFAINIPSHLYINKLNLK